MYEQFKTRAEGVSAEVFRFPAKNDALEFISQFLIQEGVAAAPGFHAVWADCPCMDESDRQRARHIAGITFTVTRGLAAEARFGISQMNYALADTGTLVQDSSSLNQRLVSTLPAIHIALLPTSCILSDMPALLTRLTPAESGYIAMITGPSRTADIERVLTIGVHGPERLVIVCIDDLGGTH